MSANNYILIDRKTFKVTHRDAETGHIFESKKAKSLDEAIDFAEEMIAIMEAEGSSLEYGIRFIN